MPALFIPKPLPIKLKARARELRRRLTDAEGLVWGMLRKQQLGVRFRRQHPVDPYVLDFYCAERKLAVEIDGGQHNEIAGREHDERRTAFLQDKGIRVLRFWNNEVFENPEGVWDAIAEALSE